MEYLEHYLQRLSVKEDLQKVILAFQEAGREIARALQSSDGSKAGTKNIYGEEQIALDVFSDEVVQKFLKQCGVVSLIASEELPDQMNIGPGHYAVAYDPLDGSSLVDSNLSVGSIFGIYEDDHFIGLKGTDQVASGFLLYGPRLTMMLTVGKGVSEFLWNSDLGHFILLRENFRIAEEGKMFAPGNLRATKFRQDYVELMHYWMQEQYTLRYSGGMVPDINQILVKGKGVFTYPGYEEAPQGKLRLLVECNPMAFLVEQAGGKATDGFERILEKKIQNISERTPIYIGSKGEVEKVEKSL